MFTCEGLIGGKMRESRRRGVRNYNRSDTPRMRWSEELHNRFIEAVYSLGGKQKATPKRIAQLMNVKELSVSHIKSHLQMFRTSDDQQANLYSFLTPTSRRKRRSSINTKDHGCLQSCSEESQIKSVSLSSMEENTKTCALVKDTQLAMSYQSKQAATAASSQSDEEDCKLCLGSLTTNNEMKKKKIKGGEDKNSVGRWSNEFDCYYQCDESCLDLELSISLPCYHS